MDYVYESLNALVFLSIPRDFLYIWFAFLFLGIDAEHRHVRMLWLSALISIYLDIGLFRLPLPLHLLNGAAAALIGLRLAFPELKLRQVASAFAVALAAAALAAVATLAAAGLHAGPAGLPAGSVLQRIAYSWPFLGLLAVLNVSMHRGRVAPGKQLARLFRESRRRSLPYFILLLSSQFLVILVFPAERFWRGSAVWLPLLSGAGFCLLLFFAFYSLRMLMKVKEEAVRQTQAAYAGNLQQLVSLIRSQRHAFIIQLQEMHTLIKVGDYEALRSVMESTAAAMRADSPDQPSPVSSTIDTFIQAKKKIAAIQKIRFEATVSWNESKDVRNSDLIRILGNLVDNAFEETGELPAIERYVELNIRREGAELAIDVSNSGRPISVAGLNALFESGHTTKTGEHSGLGLPIMAETVRQYGGRIDAKCEANRTIRFSVRLPLRPSKPFQGDPPSWSL